jgi:hypothetical protein
MQLSMISALSTASLIASTVDPCRHATSEDKRAHTDCVRKRRNTETWTQAKTTAEQRRSKATLQGELQLTFILCKSNHVT